jgi:asparagine synthase (glutamine-hydrolysing)
MCGIAGMINLAEGKPLPAGALGDMAAALVHRGPDEQGTVEEPGLGLAARRLSIVGLTDGSQPVANEDGSVLVVFNGEVFEYPELRAELETHGHRFATHCDTEILPHLWEEYQEGMFGRLRGQFAFALWDRRRWRLVLARDRLGICPLYWARQGDWLLFASEVKSLFASGMVEPRADSRGIDQLFTFFALPGPTTCFQGVRLLTPGHYLSVQLGGPGEPGRVSEHAYWEMDFPDRGDEAARSGDRATTAELVERFEALLLRAVEVRLRADVPVVAYLSGGVDSSLVLAMAARLRGESPPTFTIRIPSPGLDETRPASLAARHTGSRPVVVRCGSEEILGAYPRLIRAAECPVSDTCCAALLLLAREVHSRGYKVALTGEGADELLAGYPWYKLHKLLGCLDVIPGLPLSQLARRAFLRLAGAAVPRDQLRSAHRAVCGHPAWLDVYNLIGLSRHYFFSADMRDALRGYEPLDDLGLNRDRLRRWHPLHQSLYLGLRVHLPGLLLSLGGDRVAMHSSVETRYPFLDEDVVFFLSKLHPRWKLRGLTEKYLLRLVAERWLPKNIAWRPKAMFRAPFTAFAADPAPAFVHQLMNDEALRRTGYFDPEAVRHWRQAFRRLHPLSLRRVPVEIGLAGVLATQLWHQMFLDSSLADLSATRAPRELQTALS